MAYTNDSIYHKSEAFGLRIIKLCKYISDDKSQFVISKQLLRSGTSIGANVAEAKHAESSKDFISKLSIALKESAETAYWLRLLHDNNILTQKQYDSIYNDCESLGKILTSIIKTKKKNMVDKSDHRY